MTGTEVTSKPYLYSGWKGVRICFCLFVLMLLVLQMPARVCAAEMKNSAVQLTEEDIWQMNGGNASFVYNKQGYVTMLRGKFYEEKVYDYEQAVASINGVAALLGLNRGSEFFAVYGEKDYRGYTYYTFKQRYGALTMENAVLKVVIDPDGYTAGLSCSFTPNLGIAPEEKSGITAENAEEIVREKYGKEAVFVYSEYTEQTAVTIDDIAYHAWAVYTDCPADLRESTDRAYFQHLIAYDGSYLSGFPVASPAIPQPGDTSQQEIALSFFDGLEPAQYTGTVTLHNGEEMQITVPVAYSPDNGRYYLADLERHIMVADYYSMAYKENYQVWSSVNNEGWPDKYLLNYMAYQYVYDFYLAKGLNSVDGFGAPLLILTDYCDENKNLINNAVYSGMVSGWAVFSASDLNNFGECVDVAAHEFTHGVTTYAMGGNVYANASGAVNEGLSDVMGNICELSLGMTEDTDWLIAENSGSPIRSMSEPEQYFQPSEIGGIYYKQETAVPSEKNDYGWVHTNSSLVSHVAWKLYDCGMTLAQEFTLWRTAIGLLTPCSGYEEVHQALLFSAEINGYEKWQTEIDRICAEVGYSTCNK